MHTLSDVTLRPSDFDRLAAICSADPRFPAQFSGWAELIPVADREARERTLFPTPIMLDPEDFLRWVTAAGLVPNIDSIRAYNIVQRESGKDS